MEKQKFSLEYKIAMILMILSLMGIIVVTSLAFNHENIVKPPKPNYYGLAQMNLIPTTNMCHHSEEAYIATDVGVKDSKGNTYVLLQSKFGDEVCPAYVK